MKLTHPLEASEYQKHALSLHNGIGWLGGYLRSRTLVHLPDMLITQSQNIRIKQNRVSPEAPALSKAAGAEALVAGFGVGTDISEGLHRVPTDEAAVPHDSPGWC